GRRARLHAVGRGEGAAAVLLQRLRVVEFDQPQFAAQRVDLRIALAHADGAVAADRHLAVGRLEGDRSGIAEHRIAVIGHQLAAGVDLQRAVARVALAARRLHHQEGVAVDRYVERIAGALQRALAHVVPEARSSTKLTRELASPARAAEPRYSSNSEPSAL